MVYRLSDDGQGRIQGLKTCNKLILQLITNFCLREYPLGNLLIERH